MRWKIKTLNNIISISQSIRLYLIKKTTLYNWVSEDFKKLAYK